MVSACYDTNPPLSIFVYTPPIWISHMTGLPLYYAIYLFVFLLILLSVYAVHKVLGYGKLLEGNERTIFTLGFLAGVTILPGLSYGERDHMVALGLVPFVLAQFAITRKGNLPARLLYPVLIPGTLAILIKPHFGLLPTLVLLHRMIVQRRFFSIVRDPDFIVLALLSFAYLNIVVFIYPEFIRIILPDVFDYYLGMKNNAVVYPVTRQYGIVILVLIGCAFFIENKDDENKKRNLPVAILLCALVCLAVYTIQMKGLRYHLIPAQAFLSAGLSLTAYRYFSLIFPQNMNPVTQSSATTLFGLLAVLCAYCVQPPNPAYPTHQDYIDAPLSQVIRAQCEHPCSLFMTHENMGIVTQTAFYVADTYATRYPAYWFFPILNSRLLESHDQDELERLEAARKRFAAYAMDDLQTFKPALLVIMRNPPETPKKFALDYFDFLSVDPRYKKEMKSYEKTESFTADRSYYLRGTSYDFEYMLTWDIYKRKETPEQ